MRKGSAQIFIFGLVAAVLIFAGAFYLGQIQKRQASSIYIPKQPLNPSTSPASSSSADIANWKKYTNTEFDFSLEYPSTWSVEKNLNRINLNSSDLIQAENERGFYIQKGAQVDIYFTSVPTGGDLKTDFTRYVNPTAGEASSETMTGTSTVSGIPAINYSYIAPGKNVVDGSFFVVDNKIVTISIVSESGKESEFGNTFNQILSTFKFTN